MMSFKYVLLYTNEYIRYSFVIETRLNFENTFKSIEKSIKYIESNCYVFYSE